MPLTIAVILAAGMGVRLGALGQTIPKGFLQLGDQPIVAESIAQLHACGIERIIIVTGIGTNIMDGFKRKVATKSSLSTIHATPIRAVCTRCTVHAS